MEYFLKEQNITDMRIAQGDAGHTEEPYHTKGFKFLNERVKNLLADVDTMDPFEFLLNVTKNFTVRALKIPPPSDTDEPTGSNEN